MPCKWYLIRLPKIRFGPCVSGSVRTFLGVSSSTGAFGHGRHSAASFVSVVRCFAANSAPVLQQRWREDALLGLASCALPLWLQE